MTTINSKICDCNIQQYAPIIFNNVAYQNSANMIYEAKNVDVAAATTGTRKVARNGQPLFKSSAEYIAYLMGQQGQGQCGVRAKRVALGTN